MTLLHMLHNRLDSQLLDQMVQPQCPYEESVDVRWCNSTKLTDSQTRLLTSSALINVAIIPA